MLAIFQGFDHVCSDHHHCQSSGPWVTSQAPPEAFHPLFISISNSQHMLPKRELSPEAKSRQRNSVPLSMPGAMAPHPAEETEFPVPLSNAHA
jgi:hypothetical protein